VRCWNHEGDDGLLKALNEIIAIREAKCKELEEKIDQLDDELFEQYLELEHFQSKKRNQIQTKIDEDSLWRLINDT